MSKKKEVTPVVLAEVNQTLEDKYLLTVEYIIKRHLGNKITLIQTLDLPENDKVVQYVNDVTTFVNSIVESELFLFNLTYKQAIKLWKDMRGNPNNHVLSFILYTTSKLRFQLGDEYANLVDQLVKAFSYTYKETTYGTIPEDLPNNIVQLYDEEFKHKPFNKEELVNLFVANPWLVTLTLISMIDPVL